MKLCYYAASYGPRYSDPIGTLVALDRGRIAGIEVCDKVIEAAERAAIHEEQELVEAFGGEEDDLPEIVIQGIGCFGKAKGLFTAEELKEHRRALLRGEVIWLVR